MNTSSALLAPCVVSDIRTGTNTALDFLETVFALITHGTLAAGDFFIVDNAAIHFAEEIQYPLEAVLAVARVRLVFLPTYSPELNPCELVFGRVKSIIRNQLSRLRGDHTLEEDIGVAFALVPFDDVLSFYVKAQNPVL